jgi:L-malate glycosyltransferase
MAGHTTIKVCHIASGDLWAGAEVQLFTLLDSLSKEREISLFAILLNPGKLAEKLGGLNLDIAILDEKKSGFRELRNSIIEKLRQSPVDIVHSHRYKENILAGSIKSHCHVSGLVQTIHGISEPHKGLSSLKSLISGSINRYYTRRYFDRIIAVSEDIRSRLETIYGPDKIVTIHNAVNPAQIKTLGISPKIRAELGISPEAPLIGVIGRMVPVKAYDNFLSMAPAIMKSRPDSKFILVGDGPLKEELQLQAAQMGIAGSVIFTGFREDVLDIIDALDIFVISSLHEGIPMALLEAMTLCKAIVSTAVGGINEVIQDNRSGLLVKSREPADLAAACLKIINDHALRSKLELGARSRIDEEFSIDTLKQKVMTLYKNTLPTAEKMISAGGA